eukprot:401287-Prorocentrum_minimum.AAC.1
MPAPCNSAGAVVPTPQVMVWFGVFAVDMVYIKYIVDTVPMTSWGRVYYQNLLALPPLLILGLFTGEIQVPPRPHTRDPLVLLSLLRWVPAP